MHALFKKKETDAEAEDAPATGTTPDAFLFNMPTGNEETGMEDDNVPKVKLEPGVPETKADFPAGESKDEKTTAAAKGTKRKSTFESSTPKRAKTALVAAKPKQKKAAASESKAEPTLEQRFVDTADFARKFCEACMVKLVQKAKQMKIKVKPGKNKFGLDRMDIGMEWYLKNWQKGMKYSEFHPRAAAAAKEHLVELLPGPEQEKLLDAVSYVVGEMIVNEMHYLYAMISPKGEEAMRDILRHMASLKISDGQEEEDEEAEDGAAAAAE